MNFPVPWRCLLPVEAVDYVVYDNNAVLRELSDRTGAMIDVSGERDTPKRLSDRIVTMSGQAGQKEGACMGIVEKLRRLRDLHDPLEPGFFVLIVPASAVPVIVGAKGATIQEVLAASGAELSIGRENIMGMPDTPIGLEGTCKQVVAAAAAIHRVVQDMADRGRLQPSDFKYRPDKAAQQLAAGAGLGMPQVALPPAEHDVYQGLDPTQNYRTKVKVVVDAALAGWLIGKGGRTIREMQENSGAFLHVLREEEEGLPPLPNPGDRVLEICGRYERKLEGVQVVLRTADSMPGGQGPAETRLLVPGLLAEEETLLEVGETFGICAEAGVWANEERIVCLAGPVAKRIQAAQDFLTRLDRAHMEGRLLALSTDGECVGRDGRPRKELRDAGVAYERVDEPPTAKRPPGPRAPPTQWEAPAAAELHPQWPVDERSAAERRPQWPVHERQAPREAPAPVGRDAPATRRHEELGEARQPPAQREQLPPARQEARPALPLEQEPVAAPVERPRLVEEAPRAPPEAAAPEADAVAEEPPEAPRVCLLEGGLLEEGKAAEAALVRSAQSAREPARLELLLPEELVSWAVHGHLGDVANRCQVTIDLGEQLPCGRRHVRLSGAVAGTAAAAYWLQMASAYLAWAA